MAYDQKRPGGMVFFRSDYLDQNCLIFVASWPLLISFLSIARYANPASELKE
jgi:hypothetical protein